MNNGIDFQVSNCIDKCAPQRIRTERAGNVGGGGEEERLTISDSGGEIISVGEL